MPVPTYDQFIEPILRYLAATPEGAAARDAHEAAADALNLFRGTAPRANCQRPGHLQKPCRLGP